MDESWIENYWPSREEDYIDLDREKQTILPVISREEWGAVPANFVTKDSAEEPTAELATVATDDTTKEEPPEERRTMVHPIKIIILPSTKTAKCRNKGECVKTLQNIQKQHMEKGFADILYNFMVGGDGNIYEGRGWDTVGLIFHEHCKDISDRKLDVAYIGDFRKCPKASPPVIMQNAADSLIEFGVEQKYIVKRHRKIVTGEPTKGDETKTNLPFFVDVMD